MNLQNLFSAQNELDQHIEEQHPRKEGESRQNEKVLALLVEIGELANETRCFKFWSHKPASPKGIVLEEFVDGLHFIISYGLEMKVEEVAITPIKKDSLIEQFIDLYNAVTILKVNYSPRAYNQVFSAFIGLGEMLGFTWDEIEKGYFAKNTINHARQESWY